MTVRTIPSALAAIHKAAKLIISLGPQTRRQLFTTIDFGAQHTHEEKLKDAFERGWLYETPAGTIDVTESTRKHFADQQPKEKYVGQVAPPAWRPNLMTGTLSKKHIPNRRGPREDAPPAYGENPTFRRA